MSDVMATDGGFMGSSYRYNHGINGWSWFGGGFTSAYDPNPDATGRNQFFGGQERFADHFLAGGLGVNRRAIGPVRRPLGSGLRRKRQY